MSALLVHTEFSQHFQLDSNALNLLCGIYYQQKQNDGKPVSLTQDHLENLTSVGKYAQRRARALLIEKKILSERKTTEFVEEKGYRSKIYYFVDVKKLDALLESVEAKKAEIKAKKANTEQPAVTEEAPVKEMVPAIEMTTDWQPSADALAKYLEAYNIDSRFAIFDVLPEFRDYWSNTPCAFRPEQWQHKLHTTIARQWSSFSAHKQNQQTIITASTVKAEAIANKKYAEAAVINQAAGNIRTEKTTIEQLTDRSWDDQSAYTAFSAADSILLGGA